ncbi:exodeoxyribonuclease V subunit alpha [Rhodohalobacter sp. 8-1]|uniref:exodeoxyribonuclease V subunit alpha n=1 Tax=Rhodohalobacter sp. 8-1 TaxID=3131972 RepID=UPI0030EC3511
MTNKTPTLFDNVESWPNAGEDSVEKFPKLLATRFDQELIRFIEEDHGTITAEEKLAVILNVQFRTAGHVCLPVDRSLREMGELLDLDSSVIKQLPDRTLDLSGSSITGNPGQETPLVLEGKRLYQHRYFKMEQELKRWIEETSTSDGVEMPAIKHELLNELFDDDGPGLNWQKVAVMLSVIKPFIIISGGPGTGKTTTVARLLVLHQRSSQRRLKIALAAPTGKAAGRMGEALKAEMKRLNLTDEELRNYPAEAQTIHRLLRGVEERGLLPPVREKKLPYDMIIIDEASMIDLSLMYRLIKHLSPETRLVLLGDKNQLASVEAGSVFADLCGKKENAFRPETIDLLEQANLQLPKEQFTKEMSAAHDSIVYLTKSYRFDAGSGIGTLADSVKSGIESVNMVDTILQKFDDIEHVTFSYSKDDFNQMMQSITHRVSRASQMSDVEELLEFWKQEIWLTVIRRGLSGSDRLNKLAEQTLATKRTVRMKQGWYNGRPIIVTRNDYDVGVFNGDFGVCVRSKEDENRYFVYVQSGTGIKKVRPERLQNYRPAFFLTVHKSQGSEFNRINLLMPKEDVPVLSKELLYTAITRAKHMFVLYGNKTLFVKGAHKSTERFSGLS